MTDPTLSQVFADEWPRLVAVLVRDLGDLDLAEEAAQDAFEAAATQWARAIPDQPAAWLLTTARRKAIDAIRRRQRFTDRLPALHQRLRVAIRPNADLIDDQLALIFGCCHRALDTEAQVALTLRAVCGMTTSQIAKAFLVSEATMGKRITRAKDKIRGAGIAFAVPGPDELAERAEPVLHVVYLIFTAGHAATDGATLVRGDLCDEARWLAELLANLLPHVGEMQSLAALIALTDARRAARTDADGVPVLLHEQDRTRWDHGLVATGLARLERAQHIATLGPFGLQATIAAQHMRAADAQHTDWAAIAACYDALMVLQPGPIVALNRAVAVAMATGPAAGLALIERLADSDELTGYHYLPAARADLLRRLGRVDEARVAYGEALALVNNDAERRFLQRRMAELRDT
jgi:RNA polymerase sigma-70 factor, ECF subfamily